MGVETKDVKELAKDDDPVEALFGQFKRKNSKNLPYPENTEFRVFIGCLNDEATRLKYEALLTKSFRTQNVLKKPGDLSLITLNTTFDKEGCFHVVARYAILPEAK